MTAWHVVAFLSGVAAMLGAMDWRKGNKGGAVFAWVIAGSSFVACMVLS